MSWRDLEREAPDLARFGAERLKATFAYLATTKKSGAPRVHPISPDLGEGRMFVFMDPASPKGHDLRRNPRYALHAGVDDTRIEFLVTGHARLVEDPDERALAEKSTGQRVPDTDVLFELGVDFALCTQYGTDGSPQRSRWRREDVIHHTGLYYYE